MRILCGLGFSLVKLVRFVASFNSEFGLFGWSDIASRVLSELFES